MNLDPREPDYVSGDDVDGDLCDWCGKAGCGCEEF